MAIELTLMFTRTVHLYEILFLQKNFILLLICDAGRLIFS